MCGCGPARRHASAPGRSAAVDYARRASRARPPAAPRRRTARPPTGPSAGRGRQQTGCRRGRPCSGAAPASSPAGGRGAPVATGEAAAPRAGRGQPSRTTADRSRASHSCPWSGNRQRTTRLPAEPLPGLLHHLMVRRQTQHAQRQVRQNRRVQRGFGLRMQAPAATGLPGTVEMPHDATPEILIHRPSHYLADDDVLEQGRGVPPSSPPPRHHPDAGSRRGSRKHGDRPRGYRRPHWRARLGTGNPQKASRVPLPPEGHQRGAPHSLSPGFHSGYDSPKTMMLIRILVMLLDVAQLGSSAKTNAVALACGRRLLGSAHRGWCGCLRVCPRLQGWGC